MIEELAFVPALEQARRIAAREVSSRELTEMYLARIDRLDPALNAYVHRLDERALELAAQKDAATLRGDELPALHGVPVAIKELSFLAGAPATFASRAMADNLATFDSNPIARLKGAGMVPLGKTNAPEFGTVPYTEPDLFGVCRNPWDLERTPGGSSGGAAAALAAGLCPIAHGSDGGGSLRIPASATGLFTIKPSRGRISNGPLVSSLGMDLTTDGVISRTVADTAALLDVMSGYEPGDASAAPPPTRPYANEVGAAGGLLRVGVVTAPPIGDYAGPVAAALDAMRVALEELGHTVVEVDLPVPEEVMVAFETVWYAMLASQPLDTELFEPRNAHLVGLGRATSAAQAYGAEFRMGQFVREFVGRLHHGLDLLAFPVLTQLPRRIGFHDELSHDEHRHELRATVGATPLVNAAGLPAASVPIHWDPASGLPVGVQLVARYAEEATLVRICSHLELARPWAGRRPPGCV